MTLSGYIAPAVISGIVFLASLGALDVTGNTPADEHRVLTVAKLEFDPEAQSFTQQLVSQSGKPISAEWQVVVSRYHNGMLEVICSGSWESTNWRTGLPWGRGIYNGKEQVYARDDWVGARCPELLPTDEVEVSWPYLNHFDIRTSVGGTYRLIDLIGDDDEQ